MKTNTRVIFTFFILIVIVTGLYFFTDWFSKTTGYVFGEDEKIKLAQCLSGKNAVLYLKNDCSDCYDQIGLFGDNAQKFLLKFDCSEDVILCSNLRKFPAWEIENKIYYGVKSLKELQDISSCIVDS